MRSRNCESNCSAPNRKVWPSLLSHFDPLAFLVRAPPAWNVLIQSPLNFEIRISGGAYGGDSATITSNFETIDD